MDNLFLLEDDTLAIVDYESNFERLSCTYRMIPRTYLKTAYDNTRKDLEVSHDYIGKYLLELENSYNDKRWEDDKYQMSVVKWLLWNLIILKKYLLWHHSLPLSYHYVSCR